MQDNYQVKTAVAFFIFNRRQTSETIFNAIRNVRPSKLYVIADGPRENHFQDEERCRETRKLVQLVDWNCEVKTNFSEKNLGCGTRISSGISWVFEHEQEAIILEDDTLPNTSFFRYCDEMLEKFRDNSKIYKISGTNLLNRCPNDADYFISQIGSVWGWATWRRAWEKYDFNMKDWKIWRRKNNGFNGFLDTVAWNSFKFVFDMVSFYGVDTWDYQWDYCRMKNHGFNIFPQKNLVANIGFGKEATHTQDDQSPVANLKRESLSFPLKAPDSLKPDIKFDRKMISKFYNFSKFYKWKYKIKWHIKNILYFFLVLKRNERS